METTHSELFLKPVDRSTVVLHAKAGVLVNNVTYEDAIFLLVFVPYTLARAPKIPISAPSQKVINAICSEIAAPPSKYGSSLNTSVN